MNGLGLHSRRLKRSLFTLDRASIWTRGSRSIFAVIQQQPSVWERSLKSWRKRRCQHSQCTTNRAGAGAETEEESATRNLSFTAVEQPRKSSGLVGSSNLPPGTSPTSSALRCMALNPCRDRGSQP
jgi:hypothetical protein